MKKRYQPVIPMVPKKKSRDGLVTFTVETDEGSYTQSFRVVGFLDNTLSWQRSDKALTEKMIQTLQTSFGGQVRVE